MLFGFDVNDFADFDAFERCREFARAVNGVIVSGKFRRDPELVSQVRRALISVYSNFGEGFERDGNREFRQFVSTSKGSVGEVRGQMFYALDCNYIDPETHERLNSLGLDATRCLGGLIRYLNSTEIRGRKFKAEQTQPARRKRNIGR
jgi:four helix bundle protein